VKTWQDSQRVRGKGESISFAAAFLMAMLWPALAWAYRPFDSTDADVAGYGVLEIELGPGYLVEAGSRSIVANRTVLNLGVFPRLELVLEGVGLFPLDHDGSSPIYRVEDTGLSLKAILREGSLQRASGPSIASEAGLLLPTIHGEPGEGITLAVIVSQQWEALTVHANVQAFRTRAENLGLFEGIIVEGPVRWPIRPVSEVFLATERGQAATMSGLLGAIWHLGESLSFDVAFRAARRADLSDYEMRLGLTWDIRLWGQ
jgi:hypothetical protein